MISVSGPGYGGLVRAHARRLSAGNLDLLAFDQHKQRVDDPRVPLGAAVLSEFPQNHIEWQARAIGPRTGHRVKRVGDRDDQRAERDLIAGQAIRIAFAIHALMMVADDIGKYLDGANRLGPQLHMADAGAIRRQEREQEDRQYPRKRGSDSGAQQAHSHLGDLLDHIEAGGSVPELERRLAQVVLDSLNGYLNAMPEERFPIIQLHELTTYLARQGVTMLLIVAQHGLLGYCTMLERGVRGEDLTGERITNQAGAQRDRPASPTIQQFGRSG